MKSLKDNWSAILLALFALYIMHVSSTKSEQAQHEVEKYKMELDSIQRVNDSLSNVLFPIEIELGRYQVAYSIFMERNPKAASQYGTIISEETE